MQLRNCTTGEIVVERIARATTPWDRALGYLARRAVATSEGLWFEHCSLVHTLGMRARIDVVFVDAAGRIVRVVARARRNRVFAGGACAVAALELAAGVADRHALAIGDRLALE
jgi:uncharacterized membrane protein (UPF0127 family)